MATTDVEFNPFLPEFIADPYPFYRQLREHDPIRVSTQKPKALRWRESATLRGLRSLPVAWDGEP